MSDDTESRANPALAAEFPAASREQWLKLVSGVLKGAPFEKRLISKTYDGLTIEPLYGRDAAARPAFGRKAGASWQIIQRVELPDPAAANAQALHDLENGATALALVFAGAVGAHGFGVSADEASIDRILDGVFLDAGIVLDLQPGPEPAAIAQRLSSVIRQRGLAPTATDIRFGLDPLGTLATVGQAEPWPAAAGEFAGTIGALAAAGHKGPFAVADGRVIHNAGGSEAQELAYAVAAALAYLRALEAGGVPLDAARRMIYFRLAADADQFLTTAKFRALRKLWGRIEEACGLAPAPVFVAAETAWRMMTRRDPFVNILRTTMAVVAAGLGGADAIAVLPHTAALGLPDNLARRIARNTQLILLEESHLAKVADPAAGSGALENLTHELCVAAWSLFQDIEKAGGAAAALEHGLIQAKVAAVRAAREKAIARRKDALTGTSEFPNIAEAPAAVLAPFPENVGVPPAPPISAGIQPALAARLPCRRLAEPFEALRDAADRAMENSGARPSVFLANLGRLADFTPRASYAKNFFEAGGIAAVINDGFASSEEMIAAFNASGASLACLCSSDDLYAREALDAATALRAVGAKHIYLAGRPGELEVALKAAGVATFIYVGCDVVATLEAAQALAAATA